VVSLVASFLLRAPAAAPTSRAASPVTIEQIVKDHGAFVWRSIRRLGVAEGEIDDVAQLVFLQARERLAELGPDRARGVLYRLALGLASNHKRAQRRRREDSLADEGVRAVVEQAASRGPAERVEQRALLDRLLEPLDLDLRAVLVLHEAEELSVPEIAELLGIPTGTAASRLRRAREEVKATLLRARAKHPDFGGLP
jgi:RNA polymerase sigma-70 factor (ECF subfamily)